MLVENSLSKLEGLDIKFHGNAIDTLSVTGVKLFNSGNTIVEKKDVYKNHEILIAFDDPDVQILSYKIVYQSSDTISAEVSENEKGLIVSFEAMEKKEYLIAYIYHTGGINSKIKVDGKIKEGKILNYQKMKNFIDIFNEVGISVTGGLSAAFAVLLLDNIGTQSVIHDDKVATLLIVVLPFIIILIVWGIIRTRYLNKIAEVWVND